MEDAMIVEDKLPPHSIEAEEAVLGSILIDAETLTEVKPIISADNFHRETNRWVFEAMEALLERGEGVDQITVDYELIRNGRQEAGGAYLSQLVYKTPTSIHARYYAQIVADRAFERSLIEASGRIAAMAYEAPGNTIDLYNRACTELQKIEPTDRQEIVIPEDRATQILTTLTNRRQQKYNSIPYGYIDLDRILGGMYAGEFIIIGARPSVGKSQLMLEIALNTAKYGHPVLFASAEMSMEQLNDRELVMKTGIDIRRIRQGELTDKEWEQVQGVVAEIAGTPIYFISSRLRVANIMQKARLLKQTKGLSLVVVDYIQLLADKSDRKVGDNLRERIGYVSNVLKNMAVELDIPVIAASQFNREVEFRQGHRPMLSDLRESGDLEQDADVVLLLHRPELYDPSRDKGILEVGIAKTRQLGLQGVVKLIWLEKEHRYGDMTKRGM